MDKRRDIWYCRLLAQVDGNAYRVLLRRSARLGDAERAGRLWRGLPAFGIYLAPYIGRWPPT